MICERCQTEGREMLEVHGRHYHTDTNECTINLERKVQELNLQVETLSRHLSTQEEMTRKAELQVEERGRLLRRAEDALGPDRTPQDRREALMALGKFLSGHRPNAPHIREAAILHKGIPWVGKSHAAIIKNMIYHGVDAPITCEQGFVTDSGKWVTRAEAACIAYAAKQIPKMKPELFSEDIKG